MARSDPYDRERAMSYCLWLLGRRMYTEQQLRDKLERKKTPAADIDAVVARLHELELLDDRAFADAFVRGRERRKGRHALRRDLRAKGVDGTDIDAALEHMDDATQIDRAAALLDKHAWRFDRGDARKDRAKAYAFLARRGFGSDVVRAALERAGPSRDDD